MCHFVFPFWAKVKNIYFRHRARLVLLLLVRIRTCPKLKQNELQDHSKAQYRLTLTLPVPEDKRRTLLTLRFSLFTSCPCSSSRPSCLRPCSPWWSHSSFHSSAPCPCRSSALCPCHSSGGQHHLRHRCCQPRGAHRRDEGPA